MSNFTKGKWDAISWPVSLSADGDKDWYLVGSPEHAIGFIHHKADADLIAAAPEMYRILKAFALCLHEDGMFDLMEEAGELIASIDGKENIREEVHRKRMEAKRFGRQHLCV